jgi:sortase family protein
MIEFSRGTGRIAGATFVGFAALWMAACGGGSSTGDVSVSAVTSVSGDATEQAGEATGQGSSSISPAVASPSTAAGPAETATTTEAADPSLPTVTSIEELVEAAGYPTDTTYAALRIPKIGLEAPVATRYVGGAARELPLPSGPADIVWYDMGEWPGLGGTPGSGGNAIFSGHVDYAGTVPYAGLNYSGLGVFAYLDLLGPGDVIEVDFGGETLRYQVTSVRSLSAAPGATDWGAVWSADVPVDSITLYTCGGAFDSVSQSYIDRVVVQGERIGA